MNVRDLANLAGGALIGFGTAYVALEGRFRNKFEEYAASRDRVLKKYEEKINNRLDAEEMLRKVASRQGVVAMVDDELIYTEEFDFNEHAISLPFEPVEIEDKGNIEITSDGVIVTPQPVEDSNDYVKAINAVETPLEMFISGAKTDYGVSYIEEEEYQDEEDGRPKHQIILHMDDHNPVFLMNGEQISDWDERVGQSILLDFYRLVPPGAEPVLYVRNHRTGEDYEVFREAP